MKSSLALFILFILATPVLRIYSMEIIRHVVKVLYSRMPPEHDLEDKNWKQFKL